jgi:hypothetical protein
VNSNETSNTEKRAYKGGNQAEEKEAIDLEKAG